MSYRDWRAAFNRHLGSSDPALSGQRWNLENEKRIPKKTPPFKRRIGKNYADLTAAGVPSAEAVTQALEKTVEETWDVGSKWLGELRLTGSPRPPATVVTYQTGSKLRKRHKSKVFGSKRHPKRSATLHEPMGSKTSAGGTWVPTKRFHWITFSFGGNTPPTDDPTRVKRELGLDHFDGKDEIIYRFELTVRDDQDVWVPTCLDASLYEAWAPPPASATDPWGRTRELVDGQPRWPELLVEVKDYFTATHIVGKLVSPPRTVATIGTLTVDFMVGR